MSIGTDSSRGSAAPWPCGCAPERRLCPEAIRLWKAAIASFSRSTPDAAPYRLACEAFDRHYAQQELSRIEPVRR